MSTVTDMPLAPPRSPSPESVSRESVSQCLALLRDVLDNAGELWRESSAELLALLRDLEGAARLASAAGLTVVAEVHRRGVAADRGCSSTAALLRQMLRLSPGDAAERERLARALTPEPQPSGGVGRAELPATAQALRSGEIHSGHARVILRTLRALPDSLPEQVTIEAEAFLAEQARYLDPHQLGVVAAHLRAHLDQDGALREERDAVADRELHFGQDRAGRTVFRGRLDAEAGAALRTAVEALAAPRPASDGTPDPRTPARRRADALVDLVTGALDEGRVPSRGGERPHVTVTIDLDRLLDGLGTGLLDWGGPLTASAARRLACDARIVPVVLGTASEPLDVGRASYTVPQPMRRALVARDGGCTFPACDRPPEWCDAHHVRHWADGGDTAVTNLLLLCAHHHGVIHDTKAGWEVTINQQGRPEFRAPPWIDPTRQPRRNTTHRDLDRLAHDHCADDHRADDHRAHDHCTQRGAVL